MSMFLDSVTVEKTTTLNALSTNKTSTATSASTMTLTVSSTFCQEFTGSTAGQILQLPDATTLTTGFRYQVWNSSTTTITVNDGGGNLLLILSSQEIADLVCDTNGSAAGTWLSNVSDYLPTQNVASVSQSFDDFVSGTASGVSTLGQLRWTIFNAGTGAVSEPSANTDNLHIGLANFAVSAVSDISSIALTDIRVGGGQITIEGLVRIGALGNGTDNYVVQFGLGNNEQSTSDPTNGVFFQYSQAANTHWQVKTTNASTSTTITSTVTVAANSYYKLRMIINPAGTSVSFNISAAGGGTTNLLGTSSTNIPATTTNIHPFFKIRKTVGSSAVSWDTDYFQMLVNLTTLR